jgi:hypothetical protein
MQLNLIRDLMVETPLPSGHAFLSAASGMVVRGSMLYVVADDAHCLAIFDLRGAELGRLIPLIAGALPTDAGQRKRQKPDFEILLALPNDPLPEGDLAGGEGVRLLALGSGSTAQRMRGAVIDLPSGGGEATVRLIDLSPLIAALSPLVPAVNVEGAVLRGGHLLLFNRGTMAHPASHILEVPLAAVLAGEPVSATLCAELTLPMCAGVPLTVTDAFWLDTGAPDGGRILLSAVAEATADSYADGALVGAAIVELNADFTVRTVEPLEPMLKVEGLCARVTGAGIELLCVTDADNPERVAGVYGGVLVSKPLND